MADRKRVLDPLHLGLHGALVGGIYATGKLVLYAEWVLALERMHVLAGWTDHRTTGHLQG